MSGQRQAEALLSHSVDFIRSIRWDDLPRDVQSQAIRCLLDLSGCLIAGSQTPVAEIVRRFVARQMPGDQAAVVGTSQRASTLGAALANGFAANALDMDDGYRRIKGHPGVCILPALLAAAELNDVTGSEFLTALVVGYEIGIRAGLIRHATYQTYHSSGSWGAIAAAASSARLMALDEQTTIEAMGTAEYHAPIAPMMKAIDRPSMGKDSTGWGAMVGLASTLMAQGGFTGVVPLFAESPDADLMTGLGRTYEIRNLYFKAYACCRWTQPAIAATLNITDQHDIDVNQVRSIHVRSFAAAASLSRRPPENTEEAQYNLAFPIAAALMDRELGPGQILPPRLFHEPTLALAERVTVEVDPAYEAAFPTKAFADVTVTLDTGQAFHSERSEAKWEPPHGPSDDELVIKFRNLVEPHLGDASTKTLLVSIQTLHLEPTVQGLIRAMTT